MSTSPPSPPRTRTRASQKASGGPVTIEMVAEAAGVSLSTVSRILNGTAVVSAAKKQAVDTAIERLASCPTRWHAAWRGGAP